MHVRRTHAGSWLVVVLLLSAGTARAAERPAPLSVVTDRPDALYAVGEPVTFRIGITAGTATGKLTYVLDLDGAKELGRGELSADKPPLAVRGTLDRPGFLRCRVTLGTGKESVTAVASAGVDVTKIAPSLPVPDDFDAFWSRQRQKLAAVPMRPVLTPVTAPDASLECFDLQVPCVGAPVSGYYARPAGAAPKSLPAILHVHGAGVRSSSLGNATSWARLGALSLDINAHGIPNGKPEGFYTELASGPLKDYRFAGREDREKGYFVGMFLRLMRAMEFLMAQPEWDGRVLAVEGSSQGGGQAIAAAGLNPRVTFFAAGVPAICDHSGRAADRINGWPKLVPNDESGKPDPTVLQAARYVDCMNFATRTKAQALVSVGFIDPVCPPTSVYAMYNNLPGPKRMINEPLMTHSQPPRVGAAFREAFLEHVKQMKGR